MHAQQMLIDGKNQWQKLLNICSIFISRWDMNDRAIRHMLYDKGTEENTNHDLKPCTPQEQQLQTIQGDLSQWDIRCEETGVIWVTRICLMSHDVGV